MLYDIYSGEPTASYEINTAFDGSINLYDDGGFALTSMTGVWVYFSSPDDIYPEIQNYVMHSGEEEFFMTYIFRPDGSYYRCNEKEIRFIDGDVETLVADCTGDLYSCILGYVRDGFLYYTGYNDTAAQEIVFAYSESDGTTKAVGGDGLYKNKNFGRVMVSCDYDSTEALIYNSDETYLVKYITLERADEQVVYADGNGRIITTQQKYDDDSFELISDTARIYTPPKSVSCSISLYQYQRRFGRTCRVRSKSTQRRRKHSIARFCFVMSETNR